MWSSRPSTIHLCDLQTRALQQAESTRIDRRQAGAVDRHPMACRTRRNRIAHGAIVAVVRATLFWLRIAAEIHGDAAMAFVLTLEVTNEDHWEAGIQRILSTSHKLNVLVNSAGISHNSALWEMTLQDWRRVFAVNVEGTFLGTKHAIRAMTPN